MTCIGHATVAPDDFQHLLSANGLDVRLYGRGGTSVYPLFRRVKPVLREMAQTLAFGGDYRGQ